jgi:hypothetical protein
MLMVMDLIHNDQSLAAANPFFDHFIHLNIIMGQVKFGQFRFQMLQHQTGIQEGTENHIPAGARKAVKIGDFHIYISAEPKPGQSGIEY